MTNDSFPRRSCIDRMSNAELACREALMAVEALGAHPVLTQAVNYISAAQTLCADYIDQYKPNEPAATRGLDFATLRTANVTRLPLFKNALGAPAHAAVDGSDWSPAQWLQAVVGELGEYANVRKKFERGDITEDEFTALAKKELADVQAYLDLLAFRLGIDLGAATKAKWNEVSARVGCPLRIDWDGRSVIELKTNPHQ